MSEKTVWPDWKRKYDGLPKISDYNKEKNIYVYDGDKAWLSKFNIADIERCHIINWAKASDGSDKIFPEIATPEECEARKKEQAIITISQGEGFVKTPDLITECDNNPWIPGDKPYKQGWCEITSKMDGRVYIGAYQSKEWNYEKEDILAHRPITLSPPYVPPEPEPEPEYDILCPCCDCYVNESSDGEGFYFNCLSCSFKVEWNSDYGAAKKFIIEMHDKLYDKLNK